MRSTTPTAVQPRHRNDSKLTAKRPPGHGPRPPRLDTRDRQPLLKTRPAQSPGMISRAATAARPHLGSGKDLQSRKEFKLAAAAAAAGRRGLASTANRQSRQSRPTHTRSEQPAMYVSPADNVTRHRARPDRGHPAHPGSCTQRRCNVVATNGQKPGQRATTFRNNSSAL